MALFIPSLKIFISFYQNSPITTSFSDTGTNNVPAIVAVIGVIVAVVVVAILWRRFRARTDSFERQRLFDSNPM